MQIKLFDPEAVEDKAIVVFPAKVRYQTADGDYTRFKYINRLQIGGSTYKLISAAYDKPTQRVRLYGELKTVMAPSRNGEDDEQIQRVPSDRYATTRSVTDIKLDIPRGAFTAKGTTRFEIIELDSSTCTCKLRASDGVVTESRDTKKYLAAQKAVRDYMLNLYVANGLPQGVDRRRLTADLKNYAKELIADWRVDQKEFTYPANGMVACLMDHIKGLREPKMTIDKLVELHLIPAYPYLVSSTKRAAATTQLQQTFFAGVFQKGGASHTKNLQLAVKLSRLIGSPVTLVELEKAFDDFYAETVRMTNDKRPQVTVQSDLSSLFFVGVTRLFTKKQEKK